MGTTSLHLFHLEMAGGRPEPALHPGKATVDVLRNPNSNSWPGPLIVSTVAISTVTSPSLQLVRASPIGSIEVSRFFIQEQMLIAKRAMTWRLSLTERREYQWFYNNHNRTAAPSRQVTATRSAATTRARHSLYRLSPPAIAKNGTADASPIFSERSWSFSQMAARTRTPPTIPNKTARC